MDRTHILSGRACRWLAPLIGFASALFFIAGCGEARGPNPPRVQVSGTITLDNQPAPAGVIAFIPLEPGQLQAQGLIREDGTYFIEAKAGPSAGDYKVEILCARKTGRRIKSMASPEPDGMMDERIAVIPSKYNTQTQLRKTITTGDHAINFDLSSK